MKARKRQSENSENRVGTRKDHAMKLVDYLEALAEDLTEDDLDEDIDLPRSFMQFREAHGG